MTGDERLSNAYLDFGGYVSDEGKASERLGRGVTEETTNKSQKFRQVTDVGVGKT